ncbi:hypothetical protein TNCV_5084861 [Trichonephila clavipes]|uniref:Uncharacterized protein n=1 Tax=Trichonephila clavipes TaxID=2585209 RepID=A0A8X6VH99_TRICX|nr:hypothetical protein TNCV_5084861 [Trichonephila clavipes]
MWESVRGAKSQTRLPTHIVRPRFCHGFHSENGRDVWTLVPVRLDQQLSDHSTVDEIASGAADCRLTYTMANCPQRRKRRGESQSFLFGDADQESETRMSKNALRTGRRQAVE